MLTKVRAWESTIMRFTFRPIMFAGQRELCWLQEENGEVYAFKMEENGPADDGRKKTVETSGRL